MPDTRHSHPAAALPEWMRIDYASAVGSLVLADGRAERVELLRLERLCAALGLAGEARASVDQGMHAPNFARIEESLRRFSLDEAIRFSLMTDAVRLAFADGKLAPLERSELAAFADVLGFTTDQVLAISRWVERTLSGARERSSHPLTDELASDLEGLPVDPKSAAAAHKWLHHSAGEE